MMLSAGAAAIRMECKLGVIEIAKVFNENERARASELPEN